MLLAYWNILATMKMYALTEYIYALAFLVTVVAQLSPSRQPGETIEWGACPEGPSLIVQCADLSVPLDHGNPGGEQIALKVARIKTNNSQSLGTLFFNPGGPGGSAVANVVLVSELPSSSLYQVTQGYDLVGVDPRGAGYSTPMRCDPDLWNQRVRTAVTNEKEFKALVQHYAAVGESCANMTGPLINHLDTVSVAKDHEVVRQILGADKFNFIGGSWGSQIGYTYAEMYPETVGRMAVEGIVDHSEAATTAVQTMSTGYEATIHKFFDWCRTNASCALHGQDARAVLESVIAKAHENPIPAPGCLQTGPGACFADVSDEELLTNAQVLAAAPPKLAGWSALAQGLLSASQGDATIFSNPYFTTDTDVDLTTAWANLGTGCQDWAHPAKSYRDVLNLVRQTTALSPVTKGFSQSFQWFTMCIGWPTALTNPPRKIYSSIAKAPEILMVSSYWDPETSIQWAVGAKAQIPNSRLIYRNGSGHATYALNGDAAAAINRFILDGAMPISYNK
ncbi:Alpha/Beta hydrolase protein [Xylaria flabelliformis]|nr:Alpha/Beta hydrolase protein [Xylaria flabelliformis]